MTYRAWNLKPLDRAALRELTQAIAEQATEELEYNAQNDEPWSEQKYAAALAAQQKENALLAGVLTARGITDPTEALTLLAGEEELSDPSLLTDMDKACERIWRAIDEGETIVVFGDYDVDGVTATALLYQHLKGMGVTPKSLAKEMPETVATAVSPFLNLLMILFTPLTWLFTQWKRLLGHFIRSTEEDTITEGELMTMVSEAENDGELTDRESQLIRSAIEFDDVEVEEILTPRVDVIAVEDDLSLDEVADTFAESGYSRLPVYHGTIDNIIGVVHEKDFYLGRLRKDTTLEDLVKPTLYTTGSTQISQLLRTLREQHHHMAVVVDEYGGTEGIITLEDILEELVGEIWDEHDEATEDFRRQSDGSWIVLGSAGVDDLYERLGLPEDEDIDSNTVNGLVQEKTCHLPKVGDRFTLGEYDGVVTRTAKRRVTEVRLTPAEKPEPKKEEDEKPHFNRLTNK